MAATCKETCARLPAAWLRAVGLNRCATLTEQRHLIFEKTRRLREEYKGTVTMSRYHRALLALLSLRALDESGDGDRCFDQAKHSKYTLFMAVVYLLLPSYTYQGCASLAGLAQLGRCHHPLSSIVCLALTNTAQLQGGQ